MFEIYRLGVRRIGRTGGKRFLVALFKSVATLAIEIHRLYIYDFSPVFQHFRFFSSRSVKKFEMSIVLSKGLCVLPLGVKTRKKIQLGYSLS